MSNQNVGSSRSNGQGIIWSCIHHDIWILVPGLMYQQPLDPILTGAILPLDRCLRQQAGIFVFRSSSPITSPRIRAESPRGPSRDYPPRRSST